MPQARFRTTATLLPLLVLSGAVFGQEVRLNDADGYEVDLRLDGGPLGFHATWRGQQFCTPYNQTMRHVSSDGLFLTPDLPVSSACELGPTGDVAVLSTGEFLAVGSYYSGTWHVGARAFDAAGAPLGPVFAVDQNPSNGSAYPRVTALSSGRFAVVWEQRNPGSSLISTAPGPDPTATADIVVWEWEPSVISGFEGISRLGPHQFTTFGGATSHGANVAVGTFE